MSSISQEDTTAKYNKRYTKSYNIINRKFFMKAVFMSAQEPVECVVKILIC